MSLPNIWNIVQNISTPIALTAFIIAAIVSYFRYKIKADIKIIKHTTKKNADELIRNLAGIYKIDTSNIPPEKKADYLFEVLKSKRIYQTKVILFLFFLSIMFFTLVLISFLIPNQQINNDNDKTKKQNDTIVINNSINLKQDTDKTLINKRTFNSDKRIIKKFNVVVNVDSDFENSILTLDNKSEFYKIPLTSIKLAVDSGFHFFKVSKTNKKCENQIIVNRENQIINIVCN